MYFWLVLGKTKPKNETIRCILCLKHLVRGSEVILRLKRCILFGGWSSDRYEEGLNLCHAPNLNFGHILILK